MPKEIILAVDLGTSSLKVALVDVEWVVLGWESEPLQLLVTPEGGTEQSPEEWWQTFFADDEKVIEKPSGFCPFDQRGLLLHPGRRHHCSGPPG